MQEPDRQLLQHPMNRPYAQLRVEQQGSALQDAVNRSSPFQGAMDKLGDGLVRLGEDVISAGGHLGIMFVGLGNKLRGTM